MAIARIVVDAAISSQPSALNIEAMPTIDPSPSRANELILPARLPVDELSLLLSAELDLELFRNAQ